MRWYVLTGAVLAIFVSGFAAGRGSVRGARTVSVSAPFTAPDAGVPEVRATAAVEKGATSLTYTCKVEPPVVRYVKVRDTALTECPQMECPTVSCSGTATSETPPARVETDVPLIPPSVVTVRETESRRTWGIGPSGLYAAGQIRPGLAVAWSPWPWLELHAAGSTNAGEVDILIRP